MQDDKNQEENSLDKMLDGLTATPPGDEQPPKSKTTRRKKYKLKFKDPLKKFEECKSNKAVESLDDFIQTVVNKKLKIDVERENVQIAASAFYSLQYYGVDGKLPYDHPTVIIALAMGLLGKGIIEEVNKTKNQISKETKENMT